MKQPPKESGEKDEVQEDMEKRCAYAQKRLSECIKEIKDCIGEATRVYKYYLQWHVAMEHFKDKIDSTEFKLNSMGKPFDIFNHRDGEQRKKINSLQSNLIYFHTQKEDVVNILWKVKELFEARLEHLSNLLIEIEKCARNPSIPSSLSEVVDMLIVNDSLGVSLSLAMNSWNTFLLELKRMYKIIFQAEHN